MGDGISKRTDGKTTSQGPLCTLANKEKCWQPAYQVCRKGVDGSRQVIASYFTLEEAEARARSLHQFSGEQYHVYDLLTPQGEGREYN